MGLGQLGKHVENNHREDKYEDYPRGLGYPIIKNFAEKSQSCSLLATHKVLN